MKITGAQAGGISPLRLDKITKATPNSSADAVSADQVVLSEDVSAIEAARQAIAQTPDIRQEKVQAIRREVKEGRYQVPAETLADRILAEAQHTRQNRS
ncbi:MAG: flagellar biosynthesis anti-sigma factor FlgM [Armatimonadota bacterium]